MKKVLLFSIVFLLAGAGVFAQIAEGNYFGIRGTVSFMPLEWQLVDDPDVNRKTEDDFKVALGQPWGGTFGRIYFMAKGQNNLGGYEATFFTDNGDFKIELANVWINPISWLNIRFGRFMDTTLQGKVYPNDFRHFVLRTFNDTTGFDLEHAIFDYFRGGKNTLGGAMLSVTPIDNISVHLLLPDILGGINPFATEQASGGEDANAKNVYSNFVAAAGYRIDNIGLARLQYVGRKKIDFEGNAELMAFGIRYYPSYQDFSRIEAAFQYTGLENMIFDFGIKYAIPLSGDYTVVPGGGSLKAFYNPGVMFGLGARIEMGDLTVTFNGTGLFGNGYKVTGDYENEHSFGVNMKFSLIPEYKFSFGTVGMNIGLDVKGKEKENDNELTTGKIDFGIGAWYKLELASRFTLWTGFSYTYVGLEEGDVPWLHKPSAPLITPSGFLRIPIIIDVNFL